VRTEITFGRTKVTFGRTEMSFLRTKLTFGRRKMTFVRTKLTSGRRKLTFGRTKMAFGRPDSTVADRFPGAVGRDQPTTNCPLGRDVPSTSPAIDQRARPSKPPRVPSACRRTGIEARRSLPEAVGSRRDPWRVRARRGHGCRGHW